MAYNRNKGYYEQFQNETYLIQKIWGCLADVMPYTRYSALAGCNDHHNNKTLTEEEFQEFLKEVENTFKVKVEVDRNLRFKSIVTQIKNQIRRNTNEHEKNIRASKTKRDTKEE